MSCPAAVSRAANVKSDNQRAYSAFVTAPSCATFGTSVDALDSVHMIELYAYIREVGKQTRSLSSGMNKPKSILACTPAEVFGFTCSEYPETIYAQEGQTAQENCPNRQDVLSS